MIDVLIITHPWFVHIHIGLFSLSFYLMWFWYFKGRITSIYNNTYHAVAHYATLSGQFFLFLAIISGIVDSFRGSYITFDSDFALWLYIKIFLSGLTFFSYFFYLKASSKKREYLNEEKRLVTICLTTQTAGYFIMVITSLIGTILVHYSSFLGIT